jgi:hypothetical protein
VHGRYTCTVRLVASQILARLPVLHCRWALSCCEMSGAAQL